MEFWMLEPEIAFATIDDLMELEENMIVYMVSRLLELNKADLKSIGRDISKLEAIKAPFPRLCYNDAIKLLRSKGNELPWGEDFGADEESILSLNFDKPVFVHRYPAKCKAFYMKPDSEDPNLSLSVDMLAPEGYGEITGGGQRIEDYEELLKRIEEHKLPKDAYEWYLDLRRYGSVPHSGFGIGIERTITWVCGIEHLRETIPYPRMLTRLYP